MYTATKYRGRLGTFCAMSLGSAVELVAETKLMLNSLDN